MNCLQIACGKPQCLSEVLALDLRLDKVHKSCRIYTLHSGRGTLSADGTGRAFGAPVT